MMLQNERCLQEITKLKEELREQKGRASEAEVCDRFINLLVIPTPRIYR